MDHLPHFWDKKKYLKKHIGPVTHNNTWAFNTMLSFRKTNEPIPRKLPHRKTKGEKDGRTDGQTIIHRTLPATFRGPIKEGKSCKTLDSAVDIL